MPVVTFVVLPLFAFANAGIDLRGGVTGALVDPVFSGVVVGLLLGKQVGITGAAWLAVRVGIADLPRGVGWARLHGAATLGGVGFTMSLFISSLAFDAPQQLQAAKLGILVASLASAALGLSLVWRAAPPDDHVAPESGEDGGAS